MSTYKYYISQAYARYFNFSLLSVSSDKNVKLNEMMLCFYVFSLFCIVRAMSF